MNTKPLYNALVAILYIATIVAGVFYGSNFLGDTLQESIFLPMGFLATFVLSAAFMGYLFLYQPLLLILDGKREAGVKHFLRTVVAFAAMTVIVISIALVVGTVGGPGVFID